MVLRELLFRGVLVFVIAEGVLEELTSMKR